MSSGPSRLQGKGNLIVLRPRKPQTPYGISQEDLEELILLAREMHEAEQRWRSKRYEVCQAVKSGTSIEPGVHEARIVTYLRMASPRNVLPQVCRKLVVR